ncbi:hypothetical protein SteCoe_31402 [Stentor coeruleus]|uniref:phenylalanine 4-monooxygenase n=1 Tax=Stentor coeruleus TaxID=5963 RepID=A0A1R2B1D1_9CILI|nr:hypothetical protein SteCoe_31402 [Stentor coeruleus]
MFVRKILFNSSPFLRSFSQKHIKSILLTSSDDHPSKLKEILEVFSTNNINLTHIESQPASTLDSSKGNSFIIDFEADNESIIKSALAKLQSQGINVKESSKKHVEWFPRTLKDLEALEQKTLSAGAELESDHPGFKDEDYKKRRHEIAEIAYTFNPAEHEVPNIKYTDIEIETWSKIYNVLTPLHEKYACHDYLESFQEMKTHCGFRSDNIPQLQDVNKYLKPKTGFQLIPISGLLTPRDFLNYLAFRVFASTQYIRHHSVPFYTPEPDVVHELMGHAPLFANPDFADFSQQIGLASLGASEPDIKRLATCYWFSVEFGLIRESDGKKKVYGAGVLSSVDEILNAVYNNTEARFFDPFKACEVPYPITSLQPVYWWSNNFEEAKEMMNKFAASVTRGFVTSYDKVNHEIKVYQDIQVSK